MKRAVVLIVLGAVPLVAAACGAFGGTSDVDGSESAPTPEAGADGSDAATPQMVDGGIPTIEDAGQGTSGPCAGKALVTENFLSVADTLIGPGSPDQVLSLSVVNVDVGTGLVQFKLSVAAASAFAAGYVTAAHLTTTRAVTDENCGKEAGGCTTNTFRAPGEIIAFPFRSDWLETQATWQHRNKPDAAVWGGDGGTAIGVDRGNAAGVSLFGRDDPSAPITLDLFDAGWISTTHLLSFAIERDGGRYVYLTHKAAAAKSDPDTPPLLAVTYCTP